MYKEKPNMGIDDDFRTAFPGGPPFLPEKISREILQEVVKKMNPPHSEHRGSFPGSPSPLPEESCRRILENPDGVAREISQRIQQELDLIHHE